MEPHERGVRGTFTVADHHQGPPGFAHGGIVAAALDEAMSLAIHARRLLALTSRFEVDLRAPVPLGSRIAVESALESEDDRRVAMSASLADPESGLVYATARGEFARVASTGRRRSPE